MISKLGTKFRRNIALLGVGLLLFAGVSGAIHPSASAAVISRGPASSATYSSESTTQLKLTVPSGTQAGDVLIASLGLGMTDSSAQPTLTAPSGWTLISKTNKDTTATLAVYSHTFAAGETSYTWTTNFAVGGSAFLAAFGGVNPTTPIDTSAGRAATTSSASLATPSITTTVAGDTLVGGFYAYRGGANGTSWTPPSGMTEIGDATNGSSRSGCLDVVTQPSAGPSGAKSATASSSQDYGVAALIALEPANTTPVPPVISNVATSATSTSGTTVSWTTDQAADSQVEYGTSAAYGSSTTLNSSLSTSHTQALTGLAAATVYHYRVDSKNSAGQLTSSGDATFTTLAMPPAGATPVIVDTDVYSDADDAGALATAFGLQIKGEANVIAVNVNKPTDRAAVATSSWQCVQAIAQFYGHGNIPFGTDMPNNGATTITPNYTAPCAAKATAPFTTPDTALNVYRRALVSQPDNSVAIVSTGFMENLSALLDSPGDSISPLTGRQLVAQKVKSLTIMGGGYPSRSGETNIDGNVAAAQDITANWPTKIVWSGYEVGNIVFTGSTLSSVHPTTSPVRAAYEAYTGKNNYLTSYDLTAVYHAIRPTDPLLTETGPGSNVISNSGNNAFQFSSAGNQYYLTLTNASQLDSAIEALLDTLPTTAPDTTPPVISNVVASSVSTTTATITWNTNETANSQISYGTSTAYGSTTALDSTLTTAHSEGISGLTPSTTYHYVVRSSDAAGNISTSPDAIFTTLATPVPPVISNVATSATSTSGTTVSWTTDQAADSQVEYGTSAAYGSSTTLNSSLSTSHTQALTGLAAATVYHYRVDSKNSAGQLTSSGDATFTTSAVAPPALGPNDNFNTNVIDGARWLVTLNGSTVNAANGQLQITHASGAWTNGAITSTTSYDQTGKSVQVQVIRAANNGSGGNTYGETSVFLQGDATHSAEFFIAGSSLTAWTHINGKDTNLNPSWPAYNATKMQWLRFREAGGTLYWEYAAGAAAPGTWTILASAPDPFPMTSATFKIAAGSNIASSDVATFDNISTY